MKPSRAKKLFREICAQQAVAIRKIAKNLGKIQAQFEAPLHLDFSNEAELRKKIHACDLKGKSGVYLFFTDKASVPTIVKALERYRLKQDRKDYSKKKAVPRPNPNAKSLDGCLYVGMSSKGKIRRRIFDHVFDSLSPRTGSLKLSRWAAKTTPPPKIWVEILLLEECNLDCIRDLEKGLWNYFEPAIGEK